MSVFQFTSPPLPHYVVSGEEMFPPGVRHPNRSKIGVFDLLVVKSGCIYMAEESEAWEVPAGHYLLLRPDMYHFPTMPCREETRFFWVHFQTLGEWAEISETPLVVQSPSNRQYSPIERFSFYLSRCHTLSEPDSVYRKLESLMKLDNQPYSASRWKQQVLFQELLLELQAGRNTASDASPIRIAEEAAAYLRPLFCKT